MHDDNKERLIFRSCNETEYNQIFIKNKVNEEHGCHISLCSPLYPGAPSVKLEDKAEDTIKNFFELRERIIEEHKQTYYDNKQTRSCTQVCVSCPLYNMGDWTYRSDRVTFINLSIYPSPCQSKCIYCHYISDGFSLTDDVKAGYDKLFDFFEYLKNHDELHQNIMWQVSSGEITIHPYRDKLYKLVGDMTTIFFTNAFIFDEEIAIKIKNNPETEINVSLDSGTPSTWKKVKGVDNFDTVINNLTKYRSYSKDEVSQQIVLKYIILPGINTNLKDFFGIIRIMKSLNIDRLQISRNVDITYDHSSKDYKSIIDNAIKLAVIAKSHGISYHLYTHAFMQDEINYINDEVDKKNTRRVVK